MLNEMKERVSLINYNLICKYIGTEIIKIIFILFEL